MKHKCSHLKIKTFRQHSEFHFFIFTCLMRQLTPGDSCIFWESRWNSIWMVRSGGHQEGGRRFQGQSRAWHSQQSDISSAFLMNTEKQRQSNSLGLMSTRWDSCVWGEASCTLSLISYIFGLYEKYTLLQTEKEGGVYHRSTDANKLRHISVEKCKEFERKHYDIFVILSQKFKSVIYKSCVVIPLK